MTVISGRVGQMQTAMTEMAEETTASPLETPEITSEMAANDREWNVDAMTGHDVRSAMVAPSHVSRAETYGVLTNQALARASGGPSITGHDPSVREAASAPIGDPLDLGALVARRAAVDVAFVKEAQHAGLIAALNLPEGYKSARGASMSVPPSSSTATSVASKLKSDPEAMATLQANADLGMEAAREMSERGLTKDQLFARSPDLAKAYASDPAFHEGFDAYGYAREHARGELPAIHARLDQESIANQRALAYMSFPA